MATDWRPDHVRVSFLLSEILLKVPNEWFHEVFGRPADTISGRPAYGENTYNATIEDRKVSLQTGAQVVHWIVHKEVPSPMTPLEPLHEVLPPLFGQLQGWLVKNELPVSRVALGANLYKQISSVEEGYQLLQQNLPPLNLHYGRIIDFDLGVNIPQASKVVDNMRLNTLTRWSCVQLKLAAQTSAGMTSEAEGGVYCKCDMDFSSPALGRKLTAEEQGALLRELLEHMSRVATEGSKW